jgi:MoaA/NifB/PqqE/SkfB family radical SAM enzyme
MKELDLVILFVTSICNARCRTCFYWFELNKKGDLEFEELSKLSATMPKFHDLWISGGEPFLRQDLAKIIHLFYSNNHVRDVRIPTNGLPINQTLSIVEEILESCPDLKLEVDISIDGFSEVHDRIRGVPGNYTKALETLKALQKLRANHANLSLYVNSVITKENEDQLIELGNHFKNKAELNGHYFQIIRGDPKDPELQTVQPEKLKGIYDQVLPINHEYVSKNTGSRSLSDRVKGAYWRAGYEFSYETQYWNYVQRRKWRMGCTAGQTSIVIDYNGDVRVCELRKPIGNLRKFDMNFQRFWESKNRRMEVRQVEKDQCFCTHICFMYDSMRHSKRVMLWELPRIIFRRLLYRDGTSAERKIEPERPSISVET